MAAAAMPDATERALRATFPCREGPIEDLLDVLVGSSGGVVLLEGPSSTGKTAIVRSALHLLHTRHAYVNCSISRAARSIVGSILRQLGTARPGEVREAPGTGGGLGEGRAVGAAARPATAAPPASSALATLVDRLPALLAEPRGDARGGRGGAAGPQAAKGARGGRRGAVAGGPEPLGALSPWHSASLSFPATPPPVWVVLDDAHRLASTPLLTALCEALTETTSTPVGVLLISSLSPGANALTGPPVLPITTRLCFPGYSSFELERILLAKIDPWVGLAEPHRSPCAGGEAGTPPDLGPYLGRFLAFFVPAFSRASLDLLDVERAALDVWKRYRAPLLDAATQGSGPTGDLAGGAGGAGAPGQPPLNPSRLLRRVSDQVGKLVASRGAELAEPWERDPRARGGAGTGRADFAGTGGTDGRASPAPPAPLELPFLSKFLLLAAYVAARLKPRLDRAAFDSTQNRKRGRGKRGRAAAGDGPHGGGGGGMSGAGAEAAASDDTLTPPHAFARERLLAIFFTLYGVHGGEEGEDAGRGVGADEAAGKCPRRAAEALGDGAAAAAEGREAAASSRLSEALDAEVLMQLSSLVSLRLLTHSTGSRASDKGGPTDSEITYRCHLPSEMAANLAANLDIRLGDYLAVS